MAARAKAPDASIAKPKRPTKPKTAVEPIRSGEAYPVKLFEQQTGLGPKGRRAAQRAGLIIRGVGKTRYVLGDDWLAYLRERPAEVLPT